MSYLIVDMDDTLIMTTAANNMAYIEAIEQVLDINLQPLTPLNMRLTDEVVTQIFSSLAPHMQGKIKAKKNKLYLGYLSNTNVNDRAIREIENHKDSIIVLLTNASRERAEATLKYHRLEKLFHHRLYNEEKGKNKFQYFFETLDAHPTDCYILEDDASQITLALEVGIPVSQIIPI